MKSSSKNHQKNKRNLVTVAALLFVLLLGLSACGDGTNSDSAASGKQSEDEENFGTEDSAKEEETADKEDSAKEEKTADEEDSAKEEETADKEDSANEEDSEVQYCDQNLEDCHMMFPHIHITMDNWQDYFEFTTEYQFIDGKDYMFTKSVFNVREEWRDKIWCVQLHCQIGYTEYSVPGTIDWDNQTVTIEENAEKTYSQHISDLWYQSSAPYEYDSITGLQSVHERTMLNEREDSDGTVLLWEPELLFIDEGASLHLNE